MKMSVHAYLAVLLLALTACGGGGGASSDSRPTQTTPPAVTVVDLSQPWASSTPAAASMDEVMLARAANDAGAIPRVRSLVVARHGQIVAESYFGGASATTRFDGRSVTKSVLSLLVGITLASGQLSSVDASIGDYLGAPYTLDAQDRAVTIRQLLTMTSRYQWHESDGDDYNQWIVSADHVQYLLDRR